MTVSYSYKSLKQKESQYLYEVLLTMAGNKQFVRKSNNINPLSANPTKWSNTLKQFVGKLPTNCLSVSDHFVGLALKGLSNS